MSRTYLKELRERHNMSMQSVADKIGISRQYYQLIEAGERQKKMDITLLTKLSDLFGISLVDIAEREKSLHFEDTETDEEGK
jgi:transcriptional regulator with XRE-family HTH domain